MRRSQPIHFGARQLADPPREGALWRPQAGASALFECGSIANIIVAALRRSLEEILALGVGEIATYRRGLLDHVREEGRKAGLRALAPASEGPIVVFACPGAQALVEPLKAAGVYVTCYEDRVRIAPSVFNIHEDVDKLMKILAGKQ